MAFRVALARGVGGFRESGGPQVAMPPGVAVAELCVRLRQRWPERRIVAEPPARVAHPVPAVQAGFVHFLGRCYAEGVGRARPAS
jgi:hypothetical protein